jgi:L-arabinose isomerase
MSFALWIICIGLYDTGDGYQMTIFKGASLGGPPRLEGFGHALIRPQVHVNELIYRLVKRGMAQHFVIAPGHISGTLIAWCQLAEITCILEGIL